MICSKLKGSEMFHRAMPSAIWVNYAFVLQLSEATHLHQSTVCGYALSQVDLTSLARAYYLPRTNSLDVETSSHSCCSDA